MKHLLASYGIITHNEKRVMDQYPGHMSTTVLNKIIPNLLHNKPKEFKCFLQVMEQSGNQTLEDTAKKLGK